MQHDATAASPFDFRTPWTQDHAVSELEGSWEQPPPADDEPSQETDELSVAELFGVPPELAEPQPSWLFEPTFPIPTRPTGPTGWLEHPWGERVEGSSFGRARLTLGRSPRCHVVLTDPSCSRQHAELRLQEGRVWLIDGGSKNGVAVNGQRVWRVQLADGDEISLGGLRYRWCQGRARRRD